MSARDSLANVRTVGDALGSALHDIAEHGKPEMSLRTHPGKGMTVLDLGMPRLRRFALGLGMNEDAVASVEAEARRQYSKANAIMESPIERSVLAAMVSGAWSGFATLPPPVHVTPKGSAELMPKGDLVIVPQMAFVKFRIDFGLWIEVGARRQLIAVECDGSKFHQDAEKEKFRDAYLNSWGIPVFHLAGSNIHEDAIAEVDNIIDSIVRWREL